jgi:hypothetical protein
MSEQLLDCHDIHASINQARCERVAQRMPGDIGNTCLPARKSEACFQVNKRLAGFMVVEDKSFFRPIAQVSRRLRASVLSGTARIFPVF